MNKENSLLKVIGNHPIMTYLCVDIICRAAVEIVEAITGRKNNNVVEVVEASVVEDKSDDE